MRRAVAIVTAAVALAAAAPAAASLPPAPGNAPSAASATATESAATENAVPDARVGEEAASSPSGELFGAGLFPERIPLPDGFFPEGVVVDGLTAYVGSLVDGAVVRQDLLRGDSEPFVASPGPGRIAVGLDVDRHGRLWVAGGGPVLDPTVAASFRVYDTRTGELLVEQPVAAGFVNDVVVTRDAAWLTDSFGAQLVRVPLGRDGAIGEPELVPLGGEWVQVPGEFGANGLVADRDGDTLVVAQSVSPEDPAEAALYRVPVDGSGDVLPAERIAVDGSLPGADGLVLAGRTLYNVAGSPGVVKLRLSGDLRRARVVATLEVPGSVTPTTAGLLGPRLYVVDAKFPLFGDPTVPFETVAIRR